VTASLRLRTPAKVNPVLEVLSQRPDGYHELSLIFQAVSLFDEIRLTPTPSGVVLAVEGAALPGDGSNLVAKAAALFVEEVLEGKGGVDIVLDKRIPLAAGLGGGSSDAAATLRGMDLLYGTKVGEERLSGMAARLGSDVPFFLTGGAGWGKGRGEQVARLPSGPEVHLVLVKPEQGLSTPAVYRSGKASMTDGKRAEAFPPLLALGDPGRIGQALFNGLEPAAFSLLPQVKAIKDRLLGSGALGALVSGSGPTVFGVADSHKDAERVAEVLRGPGLTVHVVKTLSSGVEIL